jgi:hypothetical protein
MYTPAVNENRMSKTITIATATVAEAKTKTNKQTTKVLS